jgi:hypothetical protein
MKLFVYWVFLCLALVASPAPAEALGDDWKKITDRDGIRVYKKHDDDSRLKTFRGVTRMELPDEYAMLALYNDTNAFTRWLHMVSEAEDISRVSPLDRNYRFVISLPWPLKDREIILNAELEHLTERGREQVTAWLNERPGLTPLNEDYVRVPQFNGLFRLRRVSPGMVEVTYQAVMDLDGYIPTWLVNMAMRDVPYFTLQKLRKMVFREQYQGHYYDYLELFGPGRPDDKPLPKSWIYDTVGKQETAGAP